MRKWVMRENEVCEEKEREQVYSSPAAEGSVNEIQAEKRKVKKQNIEERETGHGGGKKTRNNRWYNIKDSKKWSRW